MVREASSPEREDVSAPFLCRWRGHTSEPWKTAPSHRKGRPAYRCTSHRSLCWSSAALMAMATTCSSQCRSFSHEMPAGEVLEPWHDVAFVMLVKTAAGHARDKSAATARAGRCHCVPPYDFVCSCMHAHMSSAVAGNSGASVCMVKRNMCAQDFVRNCNCRVNRPSVEYACFCGGNNCVLQLNIWHWS